MGALGLWASRTGHSPSLATGSPAARAEGEEERGDREGRPAELARGQRRAADEDGGEVDDGSHQIDVEGDGQAAAPAHDALARRHGERKPIAA